MKYTISLLVVLALQFVPIISKASHIAGGGFEYKYLGDSVGGSVIFRLYEVTLYLYQDCVWGDEGAISQDDPAFFTIYTNSGELFRVDTSVFYDKSGSIEVPTGLETNCGSFYDLSVLCVTRRKFVRRYALPYNDNGYTLAYQRCCRTSAVKNIVSAGDQGITYYCELPGKDLQNSGARFKEYPPLAICLNKETTFDHSATDADGDSLSYELDISYNGASENDIKPKICLPPPYISVFYAPGFTAETPMGADADFHIDHLTGVITVNPQKVGAYQIAVLCYEWRNGIRVNTIRREFIWKVMNCEQIDKSYQPDAGADRVVIIGDTLHLNVKNVTTQMWEPATFLNDATSANPIGTFTEAGIITYVVHGQSSNGCQGTDTLKVQVLEHSKFIAPNAFTPNGDGLNDVLWPKAIGNVQFKSMSVFNRWGNRLFFSDKNYKMWDGTYNNKPQDAGTYVWQIEYTDSFGQPRVSSGSVILLR